MPQIPSQFRAIGSFVGQRSRTLRAPHRRRASASCPDCRAEREHGVGHDAARRRPISAAAERAVVGVHPKPPAPLGRRQRLPHRGLIAGASHGEERRRRVARGVQVGRRRPQVEEHAGSGLSAGPVPTAPPRRSRASRPPPTRRCALERTASSTTRHRLRPRATPRRAPSSSRGSSTTTTRRAATRRSTATRSGTTERSRRHRRRGQFLDKPWLAWTSRVGAATCTFRTPKDGAAPMTRRSPGPRLSRVYRVRRRHTNLHTNSSSPPPLDCGATGRTLRSPRATTSTRAPRSPSTPDLGYGDGRVEAVTRTAKDPNGILVARSTDRGDGRPRSSVVSRPSYSTSNRGAPTCSTRARARALSVRTPIRRSPRRVRAVYLAWSQRGVAPGGDARVVLSTSSNGSAWSAAVRG